MTDEVIEVGAPRSAFVDKYLTGLVGLELGYARHNDFKLNTRIRVDVESHLWVTHVVDPHETSLWWLTDNSVDFVFSSHVLEHIYNPLKALREHLRVARRFVVHVLPHPDRCFDKGRELTTLEELRLRGDLPPPDWNEPYGGHWSVWTRESFVAMCEAEGFVVANSLDPDDKVGNGFIVVLEKV